MVIKATRIRTSSGAGPLLRHLVDGTDNEAITIVGGTMADMRDCVDEARRFGRSYCLRHFIIAPAQDMTRQQFKRAVDMLATEFGFDAKHVLIVEHEKPRAVAEASSGHWHVVVPEVDSSGRVLSSRHDHARHEKISRMLELEFGHQVVPGAHDVAVLAALRNEGRDDLADRLAGHLGQGDRPVSAYATAGHQAAKRSGIDLAIIRQNVQAAFAGASTRHDFIDRLGAHGLTAAPGDKPERWVITTTAGLFLGAGHRLAGAKVADFNKTMETPNEHEQPAGVEHRRQDDIERYPGDPRRPGNDPQAGRSDGPAPAGGGGIVPRNRNQSVANDGGRNRPDTAVGGSAPRQVGRAGDSGGSSPHERARLIEAFRLAAKTAINIDSSAIGVSFAQRLANGLAAMEAKAHADIAAAKAMPPPSTAKLDAMKVFERGAGQRHNELMRRYRDIDAILAEPQPSRSWMDGLLGRPASPGRDVVGMAREHAALRNEVIQVERQVMSAMGAVARAEKELVAANSERLTTIEGIVRGAGAVLSEVAQTRQMVAVYPRLVWAGPSFTIRTGQKLARRRNTGPRNPLARNIWGLPIDFG